jgi:alkylhydroperoxidase family enzyme
MAHAPGYLEANWNRSRALMQRGRFTPLQRELIATAVSAANSCHY